ERVAPTAQDAEERREQRQDREHQPRAAGLERRERELPREAEEDQGDERGARPEPRGARAGWRDAVHRSRYDTAPMSARVRLRSLTALPGFLRFVLRRWSEDRCPQIAGSLTYTTLLALMPVFAIAVAILSSAPFFEQVMVQIKVFLLLNLLPELAYTIITVYMEQFARSAARLTTVGVALVFVMAIALMFTIDRSLNAIWRVGRTRPYWVSVVVYAVMLVIGPLLIGLSMSLTTYLVTLSL